MLIIGRVFSTRCSALRYFSATAAGKEHLNTIPKMVAKVRTLYSQIASPGLGTSSSGAGADVWSKKSKDHIKNNSELDEIEQSFRDCTELYDMATECDDKSVLSDCQETVKELQERLEKLELNLLLRHDFDPLNCYIQINAGRLSILYYSPFFCLYTDSLRLLSSSTPHSNKQNSHNQSNKQAQGELNHAIGSACYSPCIKSGPQNVDTTCLSLMNTRMSMLVVVVEVDIDQLHSNSWVRWRMDGAKMKQVSHLSSNPIVYENLPQTIPNPSGQVYP